MALYRCLIVCAGVKFIAILVILLCHCIGAQLCVVHVHIVMFTNKGSISAIFK